MATNSIHDKVYTYADYLTYDENERIELIEGELYNMSPAPSRIHQELISEIHFKLMEYIKSNNGPCKVYPAPFDVILKDNDENITAAKNVVQPDISVICDKDKLTDKGCTGAPDMIVEVVSPYNPSSDYIKKLGLYEKYGVCEYWIVNPMKGNILVYSLTDTGYDMPEMYTFNDKIKVNIYEDLEIDFNSFNL